VADDTPQPAAESRPATPEARDHCDGPHTPGRGPLFRLADLAFVPLDGSTGVLLCPRHLLERDAIIATFRVAAEAA
jgi:hypothetical protein